MFAKVFLLALFATIVCASFSEREYQESFRSWMLNHKKSYSSKDFIPRYTIFKSNMDYVHEWNSKGSETVLGLTFLADLTNEEYRQIYLGTKIEVSARIHQSIAEISTVGLPASVDWRNQGAVTGVKNQGQCGACWSFSATGATEGAHVISGQSLVSLSEQNLIDCSVSYGNNGCDGGLMDYAFSYIINNGGIDTESSYPYQAQGPLNCQYNSANSAATLSAYTDVTSGSESALQQAVVGAPTSVAIDASHQSFQLYTSGVYYEPACSSTVLDHGVLAIGYGSTGGSSGSNSGTSSNSGGNSNSGSNSNTGTSSNGSSSSGAAIDFVAPSASYPDYWIVKNSWGTSWGIQGYIWMARNAGNNCGIATQASYPTV